MEMTSLLRPSYITNNKETCTILYSIIASYTKGCERACDQVAESGGIKYAVGVMNKYKADKDLVITTLQAMANVISSKSLYVHFYVLAGGLTLLYDISKSVACPEFLRLANVIRDICVKAYKDPRKIAEIEVHTLENEKNVAFCSRMRPDGISPAESSATSWNWEVCQQQDMLTAMVHSSVPNAEIIYYICQSIVDKLRSDQFISKCHLTDDEVCALALYTFDYAIYNSNMSYISPFQFINKKLANRIPEDMYFAGGLLRNLMNGLRKLPKYATHALFMSCKRGDFKCQEGSEYKWNGLWSATTSEIGIKTVAKTFGDDVILTISGISWGYDITKFSFFSSKYPEIVIEPEIPLYFVNSTADTINFEMGENRPFSCPYFMGVEPLHYSK